jgi:hypothetical protein
VLVSLILTGVETSMIGSLLVSNQWWAIAMSKNPQLQGRAMLYIILFGNE